MEVKDGKLIKLDLELNIEMNSLTRWPKKNEKYPNFEFLGYELIFNVHRKTKNFGLSNFGSLNFRP